MDFKRKLIESCLLSTVQFKVDTTTDKTISEEEKERFLSLVNPESVDLAKSLINGGFEFLFVDRFPRHDEKSDNGFDTVRIFEKDDKEPSKIIELNASKSDDDSNFIDKIISKCGTLFDFMDIKFNVENDTSALNDYMRNYLDNPNGIVLCIRMKLKKIYDDLSDSDKLLFETDDLNLNKYYKLQIQPNTIKHLYRSFNENFGD